jgi:class 3 adenylate cyclase
MTLRRRWTFSILAILALFGLNLAVYFWGNAQRTRIILDLKNALERKDLVVEIRNTIEDRQRDAEVMEPLVTSGAVELSDSELADVQGRKEEIVRRIERLHALSGSDETGELVSLFDRLGNAWLDVFSKREGAIEGLVQDYRRSFSELSTRLVDLEADEASRAREAEERFSAVADLTDRLTLAIFILSTTLAVGIAVWFSRFLRRAFARYVTAEVVDSVLETSAGLELGGEKREITVLMADLRGFSSLAERIPAEQVVAIINNFLGTMTEIIVQAGGTIDEFIGDAILVFFGAPTVNENHAEAAVTCALRMQLGMAEVNEKNSADGLPHVEMGIGVHSGEVVVGNIGSEKRTKYGAVGSSVNLAGRIEANTVGGQILISEATRLRIATEVRIDGRLEILPKGLDESVVLFDIGGLGRDGDLQLQRSRAGLKPLAVPVPIRFSVLEGKETGRASFEGELISLSPDSAAIHSRVTLDPLTDIKLELGAGRAGEGELAAYAKVVTADRPTAETFLVGFTSLIPKSEKRIGDLIG